MVSSKAKYLPFFLLVLLLSCKIEKRLYSGGYYISYPEKKRYQAAEHPEKATVPANAEASARPHPVIEQPPCIHGSEIPPPVYRPRTNTQEVSQSTAPAGDKRPQSKGPSRGDKDKIEKDVRTLLLGSGGVFLGSIFYTLSFLAGITALINFFFILVPFACIGLWIFALILRPKYFFEPESSEKGKSGSKRAISKKKAFLLAGFLGIFGAHRFYLGYTQTGLFQLFTLGGFFVLAFIDMLKIKAGKLKPYNGEYTREDYTYTSVRKRTPPNRSQRLIKLAIGLTLLAIVLMLTVAIFL